VNGSEKTNPGGRKMSAVPRILAGAAGVVLLGAYALSAYVMYGMNRVYFHDPHWPRIGWADVLWLVIALYFLLVGLVGRWRLLRR